MGPPHGFMDQFSLFQTLGGENHNCLANVLIASHGQGGRGSSQQINFAFRSGIVSLSAAWGHERGHKQLEGLIALT